jgi:hypothetical protein
MLMIAAVSVRCRLLAAGRRLAGVAWKRNWLKGECHGLEINRIRVGKMTIEKMDHALSNRVPLLDG